MIYDRWLLVCIVLVLLEYEVPAMEGIAIDRRVWPVQVTSALEPRTNILFSNGYRTSTMKQTLETTCFLPQTACFIPIHGHLELDGGAT